MADENDGGVALQGRLELREHVLALHGPVFAVLDGAQFDDLPMELMEAALTARGLYRDRGPDGSLEYERTMPRMVALDGPVLGGEANLQGREATLDRLLDVAENRPAVVFWECPDGGDVLFRHLRSINMVLFPRDEVSAPHQRGDEGEAIQGVEEAIDTQPSSEQASVAPHGFELVTFRHADANVLAQVLPALSHIQCDRFMGPCRSVIFLPRPDWQISGGRVEHYMGTARYAFSRGALLIDQDSAQLIEEQTHLRWQRQIATGSDHDSTPLSERESRVADAFERGRSYGFAQREEFEWLARSDLEHGAAFEQTPRFTEIAETLTDPDLTATQKVATAANDLMLLQDRPSRSSGASG